MKKYIFAFCFAAIGAVIGGSGVCFLISGEYNKSIAEQAIIDISQQLVIINRLQKSNESNAISTIKQDIDLVIHRHLLNIIKYEYLIDDEKTKNYKKITIKKLAEYWNKYPPFDEILNLPLDENNKSTRELFESTKNYISRYEDGFESEVPRH